MSALIESTARGIKDLIPGASFDPQTRALQVARGRELIKNLALGGLAVGGTAGAAVVLTNYLKSLGQEAELHDDSRLNDDTLYIPMPEKKAANDVDGPRWTAPGLAVTGGVITAGSAYALTQALYNLIQKKRHMALLDEAQNEALTAADEEFAKGAALGMTLPELISAFPVAVPLLAALASGGITYTALNKAFPTVTKIKSKYPKRIRAVANNGDVSDVDDEILDNAKEVTKSASDRAGEYDCELAGLEFMTLLTTTIAREKKASYCITSDIVNTVARDGLAGVVSAYETGGLIGLSESVKNAPEADEACKVAATVALYRHYQLAPIVASLSAAEYQDLVPTVMHKCAGMEDLALDKIAGVAALMQLTFMRPMLKSASIPPQLVQELASMLASDLPSHLSTEHSGETPNTEYDEDQRDAAMTSDLSGSMSEENDGGGKENDGMDEESQGSNDVVDNFFDRPDSLPTPRG